MQSDSIVYKFYYQWWKNIDKSIFLLISLLFIIGLFFSLVSTSLIASDKLDTNSYFFFFKHLIYVLIGISLIFIFSSLNSDQLYKYSIFLFFISLISLFLVPFIAYSNNIKIEELGISPNTINNFGAVSKETVEEMAKNIRLKFKTSIGIASSGIAGPGGGTKDKPVGTVWIAYSDEKITVSKKLNLTERRDVNIILSSINLLNLLRINLKKN